MLRRIHMPVRAQCVCVCWRECVHAWCWVQRPVTRSPHPCAHATGSDGAAFVASRAAGALRRPPDACPAEPGRAHRPARSRAAALPCRMVLSSPPPAGMEGGEEASAGGAEHGADVTHELLREAAVPGAEGEGGWGGAAEMQGLSIFSPLDELAAALGGSGRAKILWKTVLAGRDPFTDEDLHRNTRDVLNAKFEPLPQVVDKVQAADMTTKLLVLMRAGGGVWVPVGCILHAHMHTNTHTVHRHTHVHTHTRTHTRTLTHAHSRTHTHARTGAHERRHGDRVSNNTP